LHKCFADIKQSPAWPVYRHEKINIDLLECVYISEVSDERYILTVNNAVWFKMITRI
jgi:hypothetical protein